MKQTETSSILLSTSRVLRSLKAVESITPDERMIGADEQPFLFIFLAIDFETDACFNYDIVKQITEKWVCILLLSISKRWEKKQHKQIIYLKYKLAKILFLVLPNYHLLRLKET
jgi:hypothetical protein